MRVLHGRTKGGAAGKDCVAVSKNMQFCCTNARPPSRAQGGARAPKREGLHSTVSKNMQFGCSNARAPSRAQGGARAPRREGLHSTVSKNMQFATGCTNVRALQAREKVERARSKGKDCIAQ